VTVRHDEEALGLDLHVRLREAAHQGPVAVGVPSGMLHVLRHEDVEHLLRHPDVEGVRLHVFDRMGIDGGPLREWYGRLMFTNEGERHDRLRRLVGKAFTPRAVEASAAHIEAAVESALARVDADGGGDLVAALADVSIRGICHLLGIPDEEARSYRVWGDALSPVFDFMSPEQIRSAESAIVEMLPAMEQLVEARRASPRDDLLSRLIAAEEEGDRLSRDELLAMVSNLIVAGHDTTSSQIGCSLLVLLMDPEAVEVLRSKPALLQSVVAETIRLEPSIPSVPRTVVRPLELAGERREPGTLLMLSTASANRDPGVWADPDRLVPDRFEGAKASRLLSFGSGIHYCLGSSLASLTLAKVIEGVSRRRLDLAEPGEAIGWRKILGRSPARLPVEVRAARAD
jgi:cytochrome P450